MNSLASLAHLVAAGQRRRREQWLTPDAVARRRARRLERLAAAADTTLHYRALFAAAGVDPARLTERSLVKLPFLEKSTLHGAEPLAPVQGRTRHVVRLPHGRVLYSMMVSTIVKQFAGIGRWRVRQKTIVPLEECAASAWRASPM